VTYVVVKLVPVCRPVTYPAPPAAVFVTENEPRISPVDDTAIFHTTFSPDGVTCCRQYRVTAPGELTVENAPAEPEGTVIVPVTVVPFRVPDTEYPPPDSERALEPAL
jgi:hypothetical protein